MKFVYLGNKCDMDDKRLISEERGRGVAEENGIKFFETSAKDNINIEQAFITVSSNTEIYIIDSV